MAETAKVKLAEHVRARVFEAAPGFFALAAFTAGALTLLAVATPALPHIRGLDIAERFIVELPEFSASIAGVALMGLAGGLMRRIDTAWAAGAALFAALCAYALLRHNQVAGGVGAGAMALMLLLSRRAFYRHSHLADLAPDRRVALAIAAMFGAALLGAVLWAGERPRFAEAPWWALIADPHLGRPGRALAIGAAAFVIAMAHRFLLSRARGAPLPAGDADLVRAAAIIAGAEDALPDAQLAFSGDKSFFFVEDGFVMAARGGASLIAMGPPVGKRAAWRPALALLRAEAEKLALRPVVYAAPPSLLPDLLDLGFRVDKVGENAVIEVANFTMAGAARQKLRAARRKFVGREGAEFEVLEPPHEDALWRALAPISAAWLAAHGGREKAFSMGAFDAAYLARHHIALVRQGGCAMAFANLWLTADGRRGALDLMRFDPARAGHGLMDFLFTEILLWARARGLETFDLGMAPLGGLAADQYATLFARIGRLVAQYGETLYGFEGLRAFKNKFGPRWEPRYIAAPGAWALPIVLAETARLTSTPRKPIN